MPEGRPGLAQLHVVGLGPAGPEHITAGAMSLLSGAEQVYLRTFSHPSAEAVRELRPDAVSFDEDYERAADFESLYAEMADRLLRAALEAPTVYGVPGSPTVAERSVELLRRKSESAGVAVLIHPAVSFLDLAFAQMGIDPVTARVRLLDAEGFAAGAAGEKGPLLVVQAWSRQLLSSVKLSVEEPASDQEVVLLHHLGLDDEVVVKLPWSELDRFLEPDHLTSVFIPAFGAGPGAELVSVAAVVAELRQRCPWDAEQTHRSLLRHLLEESYEALEALEGLGEEAATAPREAVDHAEEELGDLLCQVLFHATLAEEEGLFNLADVARRLEGKLVSRHPHVFGGASAESADHVVANWEREKDRRLGRTHLFEGIPAALPALAKAEKFERKLQSVGLGYGESTLSPSEPALGEEQLGELLLTLARRAGAAGLDPEGALRRRLESLAGEVRRLEQQAVEAGSTLTDQVRSGALPDSHLQH